MDVIPTLELNHTDEEPLMTLLESLKKYTTVVADTGDIEAIAQYKPQDATTNPSLLFQAAQQPQYAHLVEQALQEASEQGGDQEAQTEEFMDRLFVELRPRDPQDHPRPGLDRGRRRPELRHRGDASPRPAS